MYNLSLVFLALVPFLQGGARAAFIPDPLPQRAPQSDLRYQPALDFDTDGCYNVAAIGINAERAEGLPTRGVWPPQAGCREAAMLNKQQVYSRQRCNNGRCVYFYAYYSQKDTSGIGPLTASGHTHDWEHIAVWANIGDGQITHVAVSQHSGYEIRPASNVRFDSAGKPMVVYHKDGVSTHCFRFADNNDSNAENHWGVWIRAPLVGYHGWPSLWLRDTMFTWDYGSASLAIRNERFTENINKAKPADITFDTNYDQPGTNDRA